MSISTGTKMAVDEFDEVTEVNSPEPHVRITRPEGTDAFEAYTVPVIPGQGIVVLAGDDGERRTMTILNTTANRNIVIGHRSQVTSGSGGLIPPSLPVTVTTIREVCASVPAGTVDTDVRYVTIIVERNKT